jgi:hypothetical protein
VCGKTKPAETNSIGSIYPFKNEPLIKASENRLIPLIKKFWKVPRIGGFMVADTVAV